MDKRIIVSLLFIHALMTFEELNKKTFLELCDLVLKFDNQKVDCGHFISMNSHFSVMKQKEIVQAIIDKKIDPRTNKDCQRAKSIVIEILKQLYINNEL